MTDLIKYIVIGAAVGGIYTLLALGMIAQYRVSNVINFSSCAVGLCSTYIFTDLQGRTGTLAATVIAVAAGAVLGLATYVVAIWPLRRASTLVMAISTIAVLGIVQSALVLRFGSTAVIARGFLPTAHISVFGAAITSDYLIILGIAVALAVLLGFVHRRTAFGLATTALAQEPLTLEVVGRPPVVTASINWALGGALSGLAGVLISPITGATPDQATSLLIPTLATALLGNLSSFTLAVVGGIVVGVLDSILTLYSGNGLLSSVPGLASALPFLVIMIALSMRGKSLPGRDHVAAWFPSIGTGGLTWPRAVVVAIPGAIAINLLPSTWLLAVTNGFTGALLLASIVLITGMVGQLSLAQASFAGVGAFVAAKLATGIGLPFPVAAACGVLVTLPVGFVVGLPSVRTRGVMLGVVTLGLSSSIQALLFDNLSLTGGGTGLTIPEPSIFGWSVDSIQYPGRYGVFALVVTLIVITGICNIRKSRVGRQLIAVRSNERAAASLGANIPQVKLYAFMVSAAIAAIGGITAAFQSSYVVFGSAYNPLSSINALTQATVGGVGYVSGAVYGAEMLQQGAVGQALASEVGFGDWLPLIGGLLLLVTLVGAPDGSIPALLRLIPRARLKQWPRLPPKWRLGWRRSFRQRAASVRPEGQHFRRLPARELAVNGLTVRYGSTVALHDVSFVLRPGEILGVVGANGAGKTTLVDAVSGYAPCTGTIKLGEDDIGGLAPHVRARVGITRSFQSLELFEDLTVGENLAVASERIRPPEWVTAALLAEPMKLDAEASLVAHQFSLDDHISRKPTELPYALRRLLGIARAVASSPSVLLLDEPASGLGEADRAALRSVLRSMVAHFGMSVLLIEHDVELVMDVSDRIIALDFGEVIAIGEPDAVRRDPRVIAAYLGTDVEVSHGEDAKVSRVIDG